jgi:hypothetical protein
MSSSPKEKLAPTYVEKVEDASSEEDSQSPTPVDTKRLAEEKALVRKLDNRILPFACILYLFACEYFGLLIISSIDWVVRPGSLEPRECKASGISS